MKIAVTYENGNVFGHFGHTEKFKIYDIEDKNIKSTNVIFSNGSGHGALAELLKNNDVKALICGMIGAGAKDALGEKGIALYCGISGSADDAVAAYLSGTLRSDPKQSSCSHHELCSQLKKSGHSCGENKNGCKGRYI